MRPLPVIIGICCVIAIIATVYFGGKRLFDTNPTDCVKQQRINIDRPCSICTTPTIGAQAHPTQ